MTTNSDTRPDEGVQAPDAKTFRIALDKIMPGYKWTVHRTSKGASKIIATGTQASGFNRLSTLEVSWTRNDHGDWFTARSAGFGLRAPWLAENSDATLARALRGLQDHYQRTSGIYHGHAQALMLGRLAAKDPSPTHPNKEASHD